MRERIGGGAGCGREREGGGAKWERGRGRKGGDGKWDNSLWPVGCGLWVVGYGTARNLILDTS